ncbi:MAG: hypothetical protein WC707_02655 [Candidatus Babeliaceae bacterium]
MKIFTSYKIIILLIFTLCAAEAQAFSFNPFHYIGLWWKPIIKQQKGYTFTTTSEGKIDIARSLENNESFHTAEFNTEVQGIPFQGFISAIGAYEEIQKTQVASEWDEKKHGLAEIIQESKQSKLPTEARWYFSPHGTMARYYAQHLPVNIATQLKSWSFFFKSSRPFQSNARKNLYIMDALQNAFTATDNEFTKKHLIDVKKRLDSAFPLVSASPPKYKLGIRHFALIFIYQNNVVYSAYGKNIDTKVIDENNNILCDSVESDEAGRKMRIQFIPKNKLPRVVFHNIPGDEMRKNTISNLYLNKELYTQDQVQEFEKTFEAFSSDQKVFFSTAVIQKK